MIYNFWTLPVRIMIFFMEHNFLSSFIKIIRVRVWSLMYNLYVSAQYYD